MARETVLDYPNRRKSSSRATKWIVVALLLVSVVLMVVASVGGWEVLQGAKGMLVAFIVIYLLSAFFIARWRSGVLPVVAALAMVLLIFAAISAPEWFERDKTGFSESALGAAALGAITLVIVPVQVLLMVAALSGFRQRWQVEVEVDPEDRRDDGRYRRGGGGTVPAPA